MEIYLIVLCVVVVLVAFCASWITNKINKVRQAKLVSDLEKKRAQKSMRKEEVIDEANERKARVNVGDTQSGFDASIGILQDLSSRKR